MRRLAIIPARGGSKRIPRKNLKQFCGKPIIAYPIQIAQESGLFDDIIVSTDDKEIAQVAESFGATVPFFRSEENSNDFATTDDVIKEVVNELKVRGQSYTEICCIYPTTPLLKKEKLIDAFDLMISDEFDGVFPVTKFSYPIFRGLFVHNGRMKMIWPDNKQKRSQDLEEAFHDAGQFYWVKGNAFEKCQSIWPANTGVIELSNMEVQDIDNDTDWELAEVKYKTLNDIL